MEAPDQLQAEFTISDLETLKVIADPLRISILRTLKQPRTVKDIAAQLNRSPTKLYYHVNQLEKHRLIQVVATQVVSGIIEKRYQAVARNYRVDHELLSDRGFVEEGLERLVVAILEDTKDEIQRSIRAGGIEFSDDGPKRGRIIRTSLHLRREQMEQLADALEKLGEEYEAESHANRDEPGAERYGFTVAFYPLPVEKDVADAGG